MKDAVIDMTDVNKELKRECGSNKRLTEQKAALSECYLFIDVVEDSDRVGSIFELLNFTAYVYLSRWERIKLAMTIVAGIFRK